MATISKPAASLCISLLLLMGGTLSAQTTDESPAPSHVSKVRIVRLSDVRGEVQMDRNTGSGFEPVLANLPVVEHNRLQTGMGVAEIEFEDNSTLRLAPRSIVEFLELDRSAAGTTISSVRLVKGMAYVSLLKTRGNEFNLLFGKRKLQLPPASHIRLQMDGQQATVAVLDGTVHIDGISGPVDISKKKTVTFPTLEGDGEPTIAKNFVPVALDSWDKNQAETHQAKANAAFGSPYSYGVGDMMYYGAFTSVGSCGSMWRPYFASANWSPYSNGVWAWYQGAGYTWVSPYPWGWTPYHFGSWSYCSGAGWGWRPGGSWNGLNNVAGVATGGGAAVPTGPVPHPLPARPIRPPNPGGPTLRAIDTQPLVRSEVTAGSFVFRRDSAGLGIPRDGLGRLDKISHSAIDHGTATTPVYVSGPPAVMRNGRQANDGIGVTSVHRGPPPENPGQSPSGRGPWNGGNGNSPRSGPENGNQPVRPFDRPSNQPERSMPQPANQPSMQQPSPQPSMQQPSSQPSQQGGRSFPSSPTPVQNSPN